MSSFFKRAPFNFSSLNLTNYRKVLINVIIFSFIIIFSSCDVSEKAEKERLDQAFGTAAIIPPSEDMSEFLNTSCEKQEPPHYPF
jgi:hypothetical protein